MSGSSACIDCSANTYELSTGSTMCDPCPTCSGHGTCSDGPTGNGSCICDSGFSGMNCENGPTTTTVTTTTLDVTTTTFDVTTTTLPEGLCSDAPATGCREAGVVQFSLLNAEARSRMQWKWTKGDEVAIDALGQPSADTSFALCIYDTTSSAATLAATLYVGSGSNWMDKSPNGWSYSDTDGTQAGVRKLSLKVGPTGKSKVLLAAKGAGIPLPGAFSSDSYFDQDPSVVVQLRKIGGSGGDTCWTSSLTSSSVNSATTFKATMK
jgi:hypothetical protein